MSAELDDRDLDAEAIEARMGSHVEGIMAAARKAAAQFQSEMERTASERAAQIETAAARRAHAVRMGAEDEAEQLVAQARAACQQYVSASRRLVDEFARERMSRIAEIGDKLAGHADALIEPLVRSEELARQLRDLRSALGAASERIAAEAARQTPPLPDLLEQASLPEPSAEPVVEPLAEDEPPARLEERLARATGRSRKRLGAGVQGPGHEAPSLGTSEPPTDAEGRADAR